jgi:hypothetical protein
VDDCKLASDGGVAADIAVEGGVDAATSDAAP